MIRSTGRVTSSNAGWYNVALSHSPDTVVTGTALKFEAFVVGQEVLVFQYGVWGGFVVEFGFTTMPSDITFANTGVLQIVEKGFDFVQKSSPANVALAYIANVNNNSRVKYLPATILSKKGGFLECQFDFETIAGASLLTIASDLDIDLFSVGDRVLVQIGFQRRGTEVMGWWQTVPDTGEKQFYFAGYENQGGINIFYSIYDLADMNNALYQKPYDINTHRVLFYWDEQLLILVITPTSTSIIDLEDNVIFSLPYAIDGTGYLRMNIFPFVANFKSYGSTPDTFILSGFFDIPFDPVKYYTYIFNPSFFKVFDMQIGNVSTEQLSNIANSQVFLELSDPYKRAFTIGGSSSSHYDAKSPDGFEEFVNPCSDTSLVGIGSSRTDRYYLKKSTTFCEVYNSGNTYRYTYSWTDTSSDKYVKQPASHANWRYIVIVSYDSVNNNIKFVLFDKSLKVFELYNTCEASRFGFRDKEGDFENSQITSSIIAGNCGEVLV